jgi:hypothetical protein
MRLISTASMTLSISALMALTCTYRTDLLGGSRTANFGVSSTGGAGTTGRSDGMGGSPLSGAAATGGTTSTGGSAQAGGDRACTSDDDCVQCVYATAPGSPDQCENALGCCGGPVMNQKVCGAHEAAWQANCSNPGYTVPICPCIMPCTGDNLLTCENGECGYYCR